MPPQRQPSAQAADPTTPNDILADGPALDENNPEYVLEQALADEEPTGQGAPREEIGSHGEEVQHQEETDDAGQEPDAKPAQEEDGGQEEVGGEITLSSDQYERIMAMLGLDDGEAAAPAPAQAEEKAPEPKEEAKPLKPIEVAAFALPKTNDEVIDLISDVESYNRHINNLLEHAVSSTLAAVEPLIAQRSIEAYAAARFQERFFEKHPNLVKRPQFVNRALAAAQKTCGPDASWDELFAETERNCEFADKVAREVQKTNKQTRDQAGRYSPKTTRQSRPTLQQPKRSPTEEALAEITTPGTYDAQAAQLLSAIGLG